MLATIIVGGGCGAIGCGCFKAFFYSPGSAASSGGSKSEGFYFCLGLLKDVYNSDLNGIYLSRASLYKCNHVSFNCALGRSGCLGTWPRFDIMNQALRGKLVANASDDFFFKKKADSQVRQ